MTSTLAVPYSCLIPSIDRRVDRFGPNLVSTHVVIAIDRKTYLVRMADWNRCLGFKSEAFSSRRQITGETVVLCSLCSLSAVVCPRFLHRLYLSAVVSRRSVFMDPAQRLGTTQHYVLWECPRSPINKLGLSLQMSKYGGAPPPSLGFYLRLLLLLVT
ncbi:unnamed protein product [Acanthosepion pharaonis]|uniref:Uncharacterized protein n=1 Tax=Acanthosepion pharaonis TaxID=158019 RepID=A0A812BKZ5_ACAPH|nr:unnamed protein product [Sepia pharaonis]